MEATFEIQGRNRAGHWVTLFTYENQEPAENFLGRLQGELPYSKYRLVRVERIVIEET